MLKPYKNMKRHKAQSAMEYLMTYGWAILIIAVVLGALFSLGVFSGNSILGTACIAGSGYLCQTPIYQHTNGNVLVTLGQNTGTAWSSANFLFVPQGTVISSTTGLPVTMTYPYLTALLGNTAYGSTAFPSGYTVSVTLPANVPGVTAGTAVVVGSAATGAIWVQFTTSASPTTPQYAQIATINVKAS
ncbi:MAG: hypothetical protein ABSE71_05245 [Candidatus Micrarchaeaceae archaeon]|jgi:hypothetical protein|nr:hypothetical protein [Candidatus Micrarchaeota archaeon]HII10409.1 hypothetical protein [Candidatus Micrarchaeota archaeon]